MNTYERSLEIIVGRIMREDARGRREPDPRLLRVMEQLRRMAQTTPRDRDGGEKSSPERHHERMGCEPEQMNSGEPTSALVVNSRSRRRTH